MLTVIIKSFLVLTVLIMVIQYFLYATTRATPMQRKSSSLPLGIVLFVLAVAGLATRDPYLAFLSLAFVALSLWLGPTTWRGKDQDEKPR